MIDKLKMADCVSPLRKQLLKMLFFLNVIGFF